MPNDEALSEAPASTSGGNKVVEALKFWAPAAVGVVATAGIHGGSVTPDVLEVLKTYGIPTVILLLGAAKLTQWAERIGAFLVPEIRQAGHRFAQVAEATAENARAGHATSTYLREADEGARAERADMADALKDNRDTLHDIKATVLDIKHRVDELWEAVAATEFPSPRAKE